MAPRVDPVASDEVLPPRADVVVIGGGIIGTSAALFLAQKGISVALCEKGHIAGEQSSRNWGWCRQQGRARAEIPLAREALRLWEEMQNDAGVDAGYLAAQAEDIAARIDRSGLDALPVSNLRLALSEPS